MQKNITLYSLPYCPYCVRAKKLLDSLGVLYKEIIVDYDDDALRQELEKKSEMKTFPQIFCDEKIVGGFSEINDLNNQGKLLPLFGL